MMWQAKYRNVNVFLRPIAACLSVSAIFWDHKFDDIDVYAKGG